MAKISIGVFLFIFILNSMIQTRLISRARSMAARMSRAHDPDKKNGRLHGDAHSERARRAGALSVHAWAPLTAGTATVLK